MIFLGSLAFAILACTRAKATYSSAWLVASLAGWSAVGMCVLYTFSK